MLHGLTRVEKKSRVDREKNKTPASSSINTIELLKIETVEELSHPSHSNTSKKETCPDQP